MILLLDIGNTRIKWAQLLGDSLTPQQALAHRGVDSEAWMKQLFRERFRPARLLVANVAGPGMQALIANEAQRLWQVKAEFVRTAAIAAGVTHSYADVSQHGIDRWLAAIAAFHLAKNAVCVIDAGTAVTADGVDAKGLHLGGFILAGKQTMTDALLGQTSDIARQVRKLSTPVSPGSTGRGAVLGNTILASTTAQAVANGAVLAIAAAADRAVAEVAFQAKVAPTVFITGGDAGQIRKLMQTQAHEVPDLVLQGLAIVSREMP